MGRKLGFTSPFFRTRDTMSFSSPSSSPWPWHSCKQPKTHSFRAAAGHEVCKIANSVYFNSTEAESESFHTASQCSVEAVIRGLRSNRLFFDPVGDDDSTSSSIIEKDEAKGGNKGVPFEGSIAVAVESNDLYKDFRVSMEEMVVAHGRVKDWAWLEEMLGWYLRVNGKRTHRFITGAFVDLLLEIDSSSSLYFSSISSSLTYLSASSNFQIEEVEEEEGNG